jgi:predicted O-methyltransferase YrrM
MLIEEIAPKIKDKLKRQAMSSRVLLDRLRLVDEHSRSTSQYQDPNYLPFYYYLSRFVSPRSMLHVGLDLALPSCCFLSGCSSVERLLCFQRREKTFYSPRIAMSNLRDAKPSLSVDYYYGGINDLEMEHKMREGFDMAVITSKMNNDDMSDCLEICWRSLRLDGILVVDHTRSVRQIGELFEAFCKVQNRPCIFFDTRYGTGATQK